ncbi:MAG: hypothetical protein Q9157_000971 [Trypethelium eluteriae]
MSREGWPPPQPPGVHQTPEQPPGAAPRPMPSFGSAPPGQSTQPQPQSGPGPVLPPPSAPMFSSGGQQSGHNLPTLQGLTQPSPVIPSRPPPPTSEGPTGPQNSAQQQQGGQGPGYVLPNINEAVQGRSQGQSEFEREREIREQRREWDRTYQDEREHEQREREARDRQPQEAGPQHQTHAGSIPLHQPHAVAPQIRSAIHGPNGLLASVGPGPGSAPGPGPGPGPVPQTSSNLGAPSGPSNIFAGGPVQQTDGPQRMQMTQSQQQALMPFAAGPGAQSGAASVGQGQQPILNDALSYLDQVKVQFVDSPDVYNRFLDIMKDFKSGAIDTPGVIERVSTLFAGNPNLIQGFNTFLPPGYRIECGMGDDPNSIRVTTPMGTTVSSLPAPRPLSPRAVPPSSSVTGDVQYDAGARGASGGWPQQQNEAGPGGISMSPNGRMMGPLFMPHTQNQTSPVDTREQQIAANSATLAHQQEQRGVSQLQNAVTVAAGASMGGPGVQHLSPSGRAVTPQPHNINGVGPDGPPGAGLEKRGPVEFNHAISYVNKIKTRFASQPDIYKQFLEILQTYQRESKPIQDVYAQVTHLFNSAPDLLEDFKQFLPESAAHARAQAARQAAGGVMPEDVTMLSNLREPIYGTSQTPQMHQTPRVEQTKLPPMGNFAPTPSANKDNKRKRGAERQPPAASSSALAVATEPGPSAAARGGTGAASSVNKRTKYQHGAKLLDQRELHNVSPTLVPALPEPMAPGTSYAATQDELGLFDRVKKHIGNKNTMSEFLKLCNLFSQDLLSKGELVYRAYAYIGSSDDLMDGFKAFLKYDDKDTVVENRPRVMLDRPSLPNCRGLTPSYRLLPKRLPIVILELPKYKISWCPPSWTFPSKNLASSFRSFPKFAPSPSSLKFSNLSSKMVSTRSKAPVAESIQVLAAKLPVSGRQKRKRALSPMNEEARKRLQSSLEEIAEEERKVVESNVRGCQPDAIFPQVKKASFEALDSAQWAELIMETPIARVPTEKPKDRRKKRRPTLYPLRPNRMSPSYDRCIGVTSDGFCFESPEPIFRSLHAPQFVWKADRRLLDILQEKMKVCSGRDELCHAVLNDEWASHPTWASEDSGFVAHRKNQYEETLHRIEEERHDYDFNIEALSRTVQLLTPYAQQLRNMTEQERKNMRLPEGLGGQSRTIHKRVIKKMYGREKGEVVCRGLAEEPSEVVPLLFNRLQAKLEEWKAAQREWDKIWREQTSKSFYRSLDHQWFAARQGDKRQFQMKTLQQEISVKWEEQQRARQMLYSNVPSFQLEFTHNDIDVILDTSSLLLTYAEYNHSTEVPRLVSFIKELLPLYFGFDQGKFQQSIQGRFESLAADDNLDEDQSVSDDVLARSRKTNRKKEDLRRGLLERGRSGRPARRDKEDSIAASSRGSSPEAVSAADDDPAGAPDIPAPKTEPVEDLAPEKWVEHPVDGNNFNMQNLRPEEPYKRDNYHLYANLSILCFFRMFFTLYERLKRLKDSEQAVHHTVDLAMGPKAAIDLNMIDKLPTNFFYEVGPTCNYYSQMLRMMSEQVQQEIEPSQVEETLRRYYLQCGYLLHQLEKLLSSLTRFAISIMANDGKDKSWDIIQLFKKDRVHEQTTHQDELNYRKQVEKYCKEGDIYRFKFDQVEMRTQIQIFKKDDATFNIDTMSAANRWTYYISSYTNIEPTEGVPVHLTHTAVLRKNLPDASDGVDTNMINGENMIEDADKSPNAATVAQAEASQRFTNIKSKEKLEMRICTRTYTPLFAPNSEDMLYHPHAFARRPVIHPTTETDGVNSGNKGMSGDIDGAGRAEGEDGDGETGDAEKAVEDVKEKLIMNNAWMKGLSKEQVDGYNEEYRQWKADANLTSGDDTEMAEG